MTSDLLVPADAEMILEGYLDPRGLVEPEGPYGEYVGYYGVLKKNPVFHLTAITRRRDALFQTVTIGGRRIGRTDTAQLGAARTEAAVWSALQQAVREPVAVCCTGSSGGMYNVRLSLRQRVPGESRNAIAAVFGSTADVKHVFVVDDDIDVFSDEQMDWALATRFQADRDFVVASGFRCVPLDPSLEGAASAPRPGSTAPSRSARVQRSISPFRCRPSFRRARAGPSRRRWRRGRRPFSTSWRRRVRATAAMSCSRSSGSMPRAGCNASMTGAMRWTSVKIARPLKGHAAK